MKLNSYIEKLLKLKEPNSQLDFFRSNGEVLLQFYKQKDVLSWGFGIDLVDRDGLVLELQFHKAKMNNSSNKSNFLNSIIFKDFLEFESVEQDSYFLGISSNCSVINIVSKIEDIINQVYMLNDEEYGKIYYSLNSY